MYSYEEVKRFIKAYEEKDIDAVKKMLNAGFNPNNIITEDVGDTPFQSFITSWIPKNTTEYEVMLQDFFNAPVPPDPFTKNAENEDVFDILFLINLDLEMPDKIHILKSIIKFTINPLIEKINKEDNKKNQKKLKKLKRKLKRKYKELADRMRTYHKIPKELLRLCVMQLEDVEKDIITKEKTKTLKSMTEKSLQRKQDYQKRMERSISKNKGQGKVLSYLMKKGFDTDRRDIFGMSPTDYAGMRYGDDTGSGSYDITLDVLLTDKKNVDGKDGHGRSGFVKAVIEGKENIILKFLDKKPKVSSSDSHGETFLHKLAEKNNDFLKDLCYPQKCRRLIML